MLTCNKVLLIYISRFFIYYINNWNILRYRVWKTIMMVQRFEEKLLVTDHWMKTPRTNYPYCMNERTRNNDNNSNSSVGKVFLPIPWLVEYIRMITEAWALSPAFTMKEATSVIWYQHSIKSFKWQIWYFCFETWAALLQQQIVQLEQNTVSNAQYHQTESLEVNLLPHDIGDNALEKTVCRAISLTENEVTSDDLQGCHWLKNTGRVILKFKDRNLKCSTQINRKDLQQKSLELSQFW